MKIYFSRDGLNIKIDTNERDYLRAVNDLMTKYVKGFMYMARYKTTPWDGKISLFNRPTRSFPYGLLFDVIKMTKTDFPDYDYSLSQEVKDMFRGDGIIPEYNLKFQPYDYQRECIEILLKSTKGIVQVATAGGKSLIISYLITNIKVPKSLILVPTVQLVDQFKSDMIEYGIPEGDIGMVNSKKKEFHSPIVVSTWQSMKNKMDVLPSFDAVIVDECHTAQASVISSIMMASVNARYRIGVTGTMPPDALDALNVKSYIGPVLKKFSGADLAESGYVAKCNIKQLFITYEDPAFGNYMSVRDEVFTNRYRIGLIKEIINNSLNSILILVEKIEKEGMVLEKILNKSFPDRKIVFLSGKDNSKERDKWRKDMNDSDNIIIIASYPIFQQGVNIPSLKEIILASPSKSYVRVIQSLGRVLRKHISKEDGAILWDICDNTKFLRDHANKRARHYIKEGHDIKKIKLDEMSGVFDL